MLIGEYTHTVDDKNRISLPVKFRKELGRKIVVTHGLDNCLFLYPEKEWATISAKLSQLGIGQANMRGMSRFMLAGAVEVEVDAIGRILLPDFLKEFAKVDSKVVFTGVYNRVEIWNEKRWREYKKRIETEADTLAEKLGDVGAL